MLRREKQIRIILGSGSPRRRELLAQAGYTFEVITVDTDETISEKEPAQAVMRLADKKAKAVYDSLEISQPTLVMGADTVVAYDGAILGKPKDEADAVRMLSELSGKTHQVYTGVAFYYFDGNEIKTENFFEQTDVTFYEMTGDEIDWYVATGEPMDKAGSYGIQGQGGIFVKEIKGDYNNVVGLPLSRVYHKIEELI